MTYRTSWVFAIQSSPGFVQRSRIRVMIEKLELAILCFTKENDVEISIRQSEYFSFRWHLSCGNLLIISIREGRSSWIETNLHFLEEEQK